MNRVAAVVASALALSVVGAPGGAQGPDARPNVVLIMTDDAGYADFGVYGATDVKTPHVDRLAREGVRLTDFYANGATCTPTRVGLISGRYQQRIPLEWPLGFRDGDSARGLPVTGRSLPRLLKNHGYATALVGKWHLGWEPEFSPVRHGFDEFFGFKSGYVDYYEHSHPRFGKDLYENDQKVSVRGYMTDLITQRAVRFIERNTDRPFFIDVAYSAAHWPYQVPDKPGVARDNGRHLGPFDDSTSTRAEYVAMLERADRGIGEILAALDRLGLAPNTIVIFTNDNGGEWLSHNGALFHHKWTLWEGGIRVPAIVRWPGRIPAGRVSDQVGITMDLTATILSVTGAPLPADLRLDGMNLMPILEGRAPRVERTLFWRATDRHRMRAVRSGDWKLVFDGERPLLFNLRTDIGERRNLIAERGDVAKRLEKLLGAWLLEVDAEARPRGARASGT